MNDKLPWSRAELPRNQFPMAALFLRHRPEACFQRQKKVTSSFRYEPSRWRTTAFEVGFHGRAGMAGTRTVCMHLCCIQHAVFDHRTIGGKRKLPIIAILRIIGFPSLFRQVDKDCIHSFCARTFLCDEALPVNLLRMTGSYKDAPLLRTSATSTRRGMSRPAPKQDLNFARAVALVFEEFESAVQRSATQ